MFRLSQVDDTASENDPISGEATFQPMLKNPYTQLQYFFSLRND